jgi:phosphoribosyl-AMP cyclohydrolase / phosphoribosyl-ATP pyrophosphohydrolase
MSAIQSVADLDRLQFAKGDGYVVVIAQDVATGAVLMTAAADRHALERTLETHEMHYTSRTRGLWRKGATSGNVQRVRDLHADCDGDAVLALVEPAGPACHTGDTTCFGAPPRGRPLDALDETIAERARTGETSSSYTSRLLGDRNLRLKKLGEECAELVAACADGDRERAIDEAADLYYHMMVALRAVDAGLPELEDALLRRRETRTVDHH